MKNKLIFYTSLPGVLSIYLRETKFSHSIEINILLLGLVISNTAMIGINVFDKLTVDCAKLADIDLLSQCDFDVKVKLALDTASMNSGATSCRD